MKLHRFPLIAIIIISASLTAAACSNDADNKVQPLAKVQTEQSNTPDNIASYKFVGNDANGYMQIPDEFELFSTATNINEDSFTYAMPDRTVIVSFQLYSKASTVEAGTNKLLDMLDMSGVEATVSPIEVNGLKGNEIYHNNDESDFHYYSYLLQGQHELRLITIEYYGDRDDIKENILSSYYETAYSSAEPTLTLAETERAKESNLNVVSTTAFSDMDLTAMIMSNDLEITDITANTVTFKIRGELVEGETYFVSIEEVDSFDYYGNYEGVAAADDDGAFIEATIVSDKAFEEDKLYHFAISNMTSIVDTQNYMYFIVD